MKTRKGNAGNESRKGLDFTDPYGARHQTESFAI